MIGLSSVLRCVVSQGPGGVSLLCALACLLLSFGVPTPVQAQTERWEPAPAQVVRAFFRAACARDDTAALALLAPGAQVIHTAWSTDSLTVRLELFSLNRTGSERAMLNYFYTSACLPLEDLQVQGNLVTWQQTVRRDADSARDREVALRWQHQALVDQRHVAELVVVLDPIVLATASALTDGAMAPDETGAIPPPVTLAAPAARPRVSVAVGPTDGGWPLLLVGMALMVVVLRRVLTAWTVPPR